MTPIYLDVHVPAAIRDGLRRRGVDVLTAQEDGSDRLQDVELLARVGSLGRLLFTQDIRFWAMAEDLQHSGREFGGLVFGHPLHGSIGQYVRDLELVAKATDPADWRGRVEHLPLR